MFIKMPVIWLVVGFLIIKYYKVSFKVSNDLSVDEFQ